MRTRLSLLGSLVAAGLSVLGCSGGGHGPTAPADPSGQAPRSEISNPSYLINPEGDSLQGIYHLTIDPETLSATAELISGRASMAQGQLVDIDVENFLKGDSFTVTGVVKDVSGNVVLDFQFKHPFPKPNLALPSNPGTNRADLGATGRLLILPEGAAVSYFGGTVDLDPTLVVDADGYMSPGELIVSIAISFDAYPYKLLADEALDNRTDSVDGSPIPGGGAGDYNAVAGGWQATNIGGGAGWTGYDFIHAGQTVSNSVTLSGTALAASAWTVDVALLMKYNNPKRTGGPTTAFRLPPATANVIDYAYRLPFAALDASHTRFDPITIDLAASSVSDPINGRVRDWDMLAVEAADDNLADETDVSLIQPGASGPPVAEVSAPFLSATETPLTAGVGQSGIPGDELTYTGALTNDLGSAPVGTYFALVRLTDPEAALNDDAYHFGVDGVTLVPDPTTAIAPVTYQVLLVDVGASLVPPTITGVLPTGVVGCPGEMVTFSATTSGGTPTSWSWNFGTGASPATSTLEMPMETLSSTAGTYPGTVTASNAAGTSPVFNFNFTIQPAYTTYPVDADAGFDRGWQSNLMLYNGKPMVASVGVDPVGVYTNTTIRVSFAGVALPTQSSDWTSHNLLPAFPTFAGALVNNSSPLPVVVNNRLVVLYRETTAATRLLRCAVANADIPFVPASGADWTIHTVDATANPSFIQSAAVHNGQLCATYRDETGTSFLKLARATTPVPSAGNWNITPVDNTAGASIGLYNALTSYSSVSGQRLAVCYRDSTNNLLKFARATVDPPTGTGDWAVHTAYAGMSPFPPGPAPAIYVEMLTIDDAGTTRFVISQNVLLSTATSGPMVLISGDATPTGAASWSNIWFNTETVTGDVGSSFHPDLAVHGGKLNLLYTRVPLGNQGHVILARQTSAGVPTTTADFGLNVVDTTADSQGAFCNLLSLGDGSLAMMWRNGKNVSALGNSAKWGHRDCPFP